jgi:hypothetical protein
MSARTLLMEELARAPESVAHELLVHLRKLSPPDPSAVQADYFEAYWKRLYGSLEGVEWNEPAELPFECREEW